MKYIIMAVILVMASNLSAAQSRVYRSDHSNKILGSDIKSRPAVVTNTVTAVVTNNVTTTAMVRIVQTPRLIDKLSRDQQIAILKILETWEKESKEDMTELKKIIRDGLDEIKDKLEDMDKQTRGLK